MDRKRTISKQNSPSMEWFSRGNRVEALYALFLYFQIPYSRCEVRRVLEQGAALSFSCGRYSSGTGKHKTPSLWDWTHTRLQGEYKAPSMCLAVGPPVKKKPHRSTQISAKAVITLAGECWLSGCSLSAKPSWVVSSALQVPLLLLHTLLPCLVALDGSFTQLDSKVNIWHLVTFETMFPWKYQRAWSDYLTLLILLFDNYLFPVGSLKLAEERVFRRVWFGLNLTVLLWFLRKYLWQQHFLIGDRGSDFF